jgi:hypothetical protein
MAHRRTLPTNSDLNASGRRLSGVATRGRAVRFCPDELDTALPHSPGHAARALRRVKHEIKWVENPTGFFHFRGGAAGANRLRRRSA